VEQIINNWIEKIDLMKSLSNYKLSWSDFVGFFKTLNDEVNDYLDNVEKTKPKEKYSKDNLNNEASGIAKDNKIKFNNAKGKFNFFLIRPIESLKILIY
jgi:3-methyladenine DNA glycosylase AlkC